MSRVGVVVNMRPAGTSGETTSSSVLLTSGAAVIWEVIGTSISSSKLWPLLGRFTKAGFCLNGVVDFLNSLLANLTELVLASEKLTFLLLLLLLLLLMMMLLLLLLLLKSTLPLLTLANPFLLLPLKPGVPPPFPRPFLRLEISPSARLAELRAIKNV